MGKRSWLERGWCRLERVACAFLKPDSKILEKLGVFDFFVLKEVGCFGGVYNVGPTSYIIYIFVLNIYTFIYIYIRVGTLPSKDHQKSRCSPKDPIDYLLSREFESSNRTHWMQTWVSNRSIATCWTGSVEIRPHLDVWWIFTPPKFNSEFTPESHDGFFRRSWILLGWSFFRGRPVQLPWGNSLGLPGFLFTYFGMFQILESQI